MRLRSAEVFSFHIDSNTFTLRFEAMPRKNFNQCCGSLISCGDKRWIDDNTHKHTHKVTHKSESCGPNHIVNQPTLHDDQ